MSVIDLHLHTAASDGVLSPRALVERAASAGVTTLSVTDHDTLAGLDEARASAADLDITFVNGIEITAVEDGRDVHVLGYFVDPASAPLAEFLRAQRADRVRRVAGIVERLAALGIVIPLEPLIEAAAVSGRSIGRPHVAQALVDGGYVQTADEAFERYLDARGPAFVERRGAPVARVIDVIHAAGGVASLAHPGLARIDPLIPRLAAAGLDALEARHGDHDAEMESRYRALAAALNLAVTAGSDFHGDAAGRTSSSLGTITMTSDELTALHARRR